MLTRILSLILFASLAAALLWIPEPDSNRLAAVEVGSLLTEPVLAPESPPQQAPPLWRALIEEREGRPRVRLGGLRLTSELSAVDDPALHGEARRSLLRALRAICASEELAVDVEGTLMPVRGGIEIESRYTVEGLELVLQLPDGRQLAARRAWSPPQRSSLYPPLIAILLAILFRRPVLALFMGVFTGAFLLNFYRGADLFESTRGGLHDLFSKYLMTELVDTDRQLIIGFVLFMLAMVGVMTRSGGIRGLMDAIATIASSVRRTQVASWLMGLAVFFDDYANTILVGTTMRPLSDRYKIAREKLAYIVDSTAAPVAGLSIFSTWIAFEVSTFSAQLPDVGYSVQDGYGIFLETLPYRFYCIFTLLFVGMIVLSGRDLGPMLRAERRARAGDVIRRDGTPLVSEHATALEASPQVTPNASRALLPILTFILVTLAWMAWKGGAFDPRVDLFRLQDLAKVLYDGDTFRALMIGSASGFALACLLALTAGLRAEILSASWASLRAMGVAFVILYLAWMIGAVCGDLGTAPYLTVLVGDALNPLLLPVILFLLSGVVAFSTGSSWSTMTILLPIVVGLAHGLGEQIPVGGHMLMILSIGAVLEGAIFGDHCSPISDTTVMSSIACASDHIDHVRTQSPYAVLTMIVAMVAGYFPCTFLGWNPLLSIALGAGLLWLCLWKLGGRADRRSRAEA